MVPTEKFFCTKIYHTKISLHENFQIYGINSIMAQTFVIVRDNDLSETILHSSVQRLSRHGRQSDVEYFDALSNNVVVYESNEYCSGCLSRLEGEDFIPGTVTS